MFCTLGTGPKFRCIKYRICIDHFFSSSVSYRMVSNSITVVAPISFFVYRYYIGIISYRIVSYRIVSNSFKLSFYIRYPTLLVTIKLMVPVMVRVLVTLIVPVTGNGIHLPVMSNMAVRLVSTLTLAPARTCRSWAVSRRRRVSSSSEACDKRE